MARAMRRRKAESSRDKAVSTIDSRRDQMFPVFDADQIASWEDTRTGGNSPCAPHWRAPELPPDGRVTTTAWFNTPGEYVLRARADDGALTADQQVIIVVKP